MKILFFISTLENDGAERAMSNITMHLPDDVEADILLNSVSEHDFPTKANIINLGMKPNAKKGAKYHLVAFCKRITTLRRLKRNNEYDACISFMDSANICNILTGNKYCKTIVSVRVSVATDKSFIYKFIVSPLVRLLYNKSDYVVACSEGISQELKQIYKIKEEKIRVITNGYDYNEIRRKMMEEVELPIPDFKNKFVFATMGRLNTQKAQWHLIRAFVPIAKKYDNTYLVIMGQGEEERYLRQLICEYKMDNRIFILGYQKNPFAVLNECDVFVMPSLFEGYCNALCEALICGLPCIATDFRTSAREILAPKTDLNKQLQDDIEYAEYGILIPVFSGEKLDSKENLSNEEIILYKGMEEMMNNNDLRHELQQKALIRGKELDVQIKVLEWIRLI